MLGEFERMESPEYWKEQEERMKVASQALRESFPQYYQKRVPLIAAPSIGRNEPCPCGSGKKFKKCCG